MVISVNNINFFYGAEQVLFDVSFKAKTGDVLVLLGASGAGKSTLMRCLNLLLQPQSGQISVAGRDIDLGKKATKEQIAHLRRVIGIVFQQYHLWEHLTVLENLIQAPMKVLKISKDEAINQATSYLKRLNLEALAKRYPLQLSGGQQQRVAIARTLMMQPEVIIFDEPTAALDPEITTQVIQIIKELSNNNITQIVVTHDLWFAKQVANKLIYMEKGKIIESGDSSHFIEPKTQKFANYLSHFE